MRVYNSTKAWHLVAWCDMDAEHTLLFGPKSPAILLAILLERYTFSKSGFPMGHMKLRPVDPREATTQEEQTIPQLVNTSSNFP